MYTPVNPKPKPDPLRNKIVSLVDPVKAAMEVRMCELEALVSSLRDEIATLNRSNAQIAAAFEPVECRAIRLEHIIRVTAKYYGLTVENLKSARRMAELTRPRHVAMYLCRELTIKSLPEIGRHLGGRDHTTILYGAAKIADRIKVDAALCQEVAELEGLFA